MAEQLKFQVRGNDSDVWLDVVDSECNFVEPMWYEGVQYRRKPKPEVVKPKWEHKEFDGDRLRQAYNSVLGDSSWNSFVRCANKAIEMALETGLVVLPSTNTNSSVQSINYKKDAETWGGALNEAAWEFIENNPEKSALLFNTCKGSLRAAILKYLERIEGNSL